MDHGVVAVVGAEWRLYYSDGSVVRGRSADDWRAAPDIGVQAVVLMRRPLMPRWTFVRDGQLAVARDRMVWGGDESYDPFGWGEKVGTLMPDADFYAIWDRACGDG